MAGKDLGFPVGQTTASSLKEQLARKTLRNIRMQGHAYVDLREDGKRYIFFCTLCLAPCYSDTVLFDHLRGNFHKERYASAKATLIGSNPWPFDDGILFFHQLDEQNPNTNSSVDGRMDLYESRDGNESSQAIIVHPSEAALSGSANGRINREGGYGSGNECSDYYDKPYDLVIPGVVAKDDLCDLGVKLMGFGLISARLLEKDKAPTRVKSIWCEWLGKIDENDIKNISAADDFAIVTFRYYYDLGNQGLFEDIKSLLMPKDDNDDQGNPRKRQRKSFSDPEDVNESLSSQWDSAGEDSSNNVNSKLLVDHYNGQLLNSRIIRSKTLRRELRKQQRLAAERMCDICQHKMLPGKDVAALLNMTTGRLACSRRNIHGAFHVYHTSCLIHWILLCDSEMYADKPEEPTSKQKPKRKIRSKSGGIVEEKDCAKRSGIRKQSEGKVIPQLIRSVFCSECQGSGMGSEEDELEQPIYHLSEIFRYKMKLIDGRRCWMKHPEKLQNRSTGLDFAVQGEETKERVSTLKVLRFYRANEDSWIFNS